MSTPKILLAYPHYSEAVVFASCVSKDHAEANYMHPEEDAVEIFAKVGTKASLLPWSFNSGLAEALNKRDEGLVTHFALHHSDVAAPEGWLNCLYSEMRKRGDVAVSAVVNIKEPARLRTSCAVGCRNDHFEIRKYITTPDRLRMPETFGTADVIDNDDEVLLINTGLLLMDLSWPGFDEFAFEFKDKIAVDPSTGKRRAMVVPEDWGASYWLDSHGAPYSATWKVKTQHHGPSVWDSHEIPPVSIG